MTLIDDIVRNQYCFTDGNGLVSRGLSRLIAHRLSIDIKNPENIPSAYQIRMAGCKGLIITDPHSTFDQLYIKIRPSMKKFECNDWTLDICDFSRPSKVLIVEENSLNEKRFTCCVLSVKSIEQSDNLAFVGSRRSGSNVLSSSATLVQQTTVTVETIAVNLFV